MQIPAATASGPKRHAKNALFLREYMDSNRLQQRPYPRKVPAGPCKRLCKVVLSALSRCILKGDGRYSIEGVDFKLI